MFKDAPFQVYGKLEMTNPGGSAKDRPALHMLKQAVKRGEVGPGTTIIESSSGNLAVSLAQICGCLGLPFICVLDSRTTSYHLRLIRSLGARVEWIDKPDPETGEYLPARIRRVKELLSEIPDSYWTNQYGNPDNYLAHYETTMPEIRQALGQVDYLFCGVSTCGTIRGCSERIRDDGLPTKVIAVDAVGSVIFGGDGRASRRLPGLGAAIVPQQLRSELVDRVVYVDDLACVRGCRDLLRTESILAGASSGGVLEAIRLMQDDIPAGSVCAAILVDRGDRYWDTVFSDEWVASLAGPTRSVAGPGLDSNLDSSRAFDSGSGSGGEAKP